MTFDHLSAALTAALTVSTCTAVAQAQKMPVATNLTLQVHDLSKLGNDDLPFDGEAIAAFARRFVEPALGPEHGIQLLGDRHLTVLGTEPQCAWVERLIARCQELHGTQIDVESWIMRADTSLFERQLDAVFGPEQDGDQRFAVLKPKRAAELERSLKQDDAVEMIHAPRLLTYHAGKARLSVGRSVSCTRDFEVELVDGKPVTTPVTETLFDGITVDLFGACLHDGTVSLDYRVTQSDIELPLPAVDVEVYPGVEREIHAPLRRSVEMAQSVELPVGCAGLVAVRRASGSWLVTFVRATHRE